MTGGAKEDLLATLKPAQVMGKAAWSTPVTFKKPGVYIFYVEPEPYWEPAETLDISHYTKVVVPAFGEEEGWDKEVGLETEVAAPTRPFGNYAGNVFQGIVKVDGKAGALMPMWRSSSSIPGGRRRGPDRVHDHTRWSRPTATVCSPTPRPGRAGGGSQP